MTVFNTIIDVAIFPVKRSPLSLISLFQLTVTHFVLAEGVACLDTQKSCFWCVGRGRKNKSVLDFDELGSTYIRVLPKG
ncbi:hypothetical protein [Enterovibrio norvegicus]|uniref:Uncharacterized protein n=1 Tax=Enterovibrio norvegicus TaxID=188144 RepID=A0A2N7L9J4_9GAMM|nr:hypothetical protein [Enterovibrio norvegicus]PMN91069.1 hypothetical protein BCT23_18345 [Enterovibrio norvegicus]